MSERKVREGGWEGGVGEENAVRSVSGGGGSEGGCDRERGEGGTGEEM